MKTIEEIINGNRDFFDGAEPSAGHMERFNRKLEIRFRKNAARRSIVPYLLRAAVITLLVTLSSLWVWDNFIRSGSSRMTLGQVSPEYKEVENYYMYQVNYMQDEMSNLGMLDDPEHKLLLEREMKSMDSTYTQLQKELKANPNDERVINAMIEHYQTKVEVMSLILNQLKAIRNENSNTKEDENVSI
jgi:hypothetical protein